MQFCLSSIWMKLTLPDLNQPPYPAMVSELLCFKMIIYKIWYFFLLFANLTNQFTFTDLFWIQKENMLAIMSIFGITIFDIITYSARPLFLYKFLKITRLGQKSF